MGFPIARQLGSPMLGVGGRERREEERREDKREKHQLGNVLSFQLGFKRSAMFYFGGPHKSAQVQGEEKYITPCDEE